MEQKEIKDLNIGGRVGIFISFVTAFLLALTVFAIAGILPGGNAVSWNTDTMDQMAAFYAMLARHIKNGESIFYSWETSMGQNTALIYALCSYSPVLLIYLFVSDIYTATILALLIKIALCSMFFYVFLEFGLCWKGKWNLFFSMCYAFSGFMLEYMMATNLTDALYILPMIMYAILRSMKTHKYVLLTLIYIFSFINELYMSFLTGLFSAAAMLAILYLKDGRSFIRKNAVYLMRYALSVVTAIMISMCLLFPAIAGYFSYNGFNGVLDVDHISILDLLYSLLFGRPTSLKTNIPYCYCGLAVIMLLPLYFTNKEISLKERVLSGSALVLTVASLYIDPIYLFLHVFNRPDGFTVRYAFCFVFTFIVLAARTFYSGRAIVEKTKGFRYFGYILAFLIIALSLILIHDNIGEVADGKGVNYALIGNFILIPLWGVGAYLYSRNKTRRGATVFLFLLLFAELGSQAVFNVREQGLLWSGEINEKRLQAESFIDQMNAAKEHDLSPYRAYIAAYPGYNQSAIYGYMGIGQFSSSNYAHINKIMKRLGNGASAVSYTQEGATDLTDMILGIRYRGRIVSDSRTREVQFEVYDNALPIAYMCAEDILKEVPYDGDPLEYQNAIVSAMCGKDIKVYESADIYAYNANNASFTETEEGYSLCIIDSDKSGDILFGIPKDGYDHAYAYFQIFPYNGMTEEYRIPDGMVAEAALFSTDDRKGNGAHFDLVGYNSLMEMTKDENAFVIRLADYETSEKSFDYYLHLFYYQNDEMLKNAYDILSRDGWKVEEWEDTFIKARVNAMADKTVLFNSIPYDQGWKAYVDGRETLINTVLEGSFIALRIGEGEHEIIFEYEAPGKTAGILISSFGMLIFLSTILIENKSKKHENIGNIDDAEE